MPIAIVILSLSVVLAGLIASAYGGYNGWGPFSVAIIALGLALNKAFTKSPSGSGLFSQIISRTFVNYPLMLGLSALFYGAGYLLASAF